MLQPLERRRLLKIVGAFFCATAVWPADAKGTIQPSQRKTLSAFLDTLLPKDAFSGSATDLQVDSKLWAFAKTDARFAHLISLGCQWLNLTGGPPFAQLSMEQQIAVVEWMSQSDWNEIPRRFYELVRQLAAELYYSDPRSWAGLPIQHAPQPDGYPPPWV